MAFIDTPLDIAMARRLLRDITNQTAQNAEDSIKSIKANLSSYLNGGQLLYLELENQIKRNSDIVLDGRLTADELATAIYTRIRPQRPN